jgi:chemotaxis protein methyltransferase CheR
LAIEALYQKHFKTTPLDINNIKTLPLNSIYIYAVDISETFIEKAKSGIYENSPSSTIRKILEEHKRIFFMQKENSLEVQPFVKNLITFQVANAMNPLQKKDFDIIVCRNLLIYFSEEKKKQCQENLLHALKTGGYLCLGAVDRFLLDPSLVIQCTDEHSIWYKKK